MGEAAAGGTRIFPLAVGEHVFVWGLQTQTDLNFNERGFVDYNKEKKRCVVTLVCGREVLVKLENLLFYA